MKPDYKLMIIELLEAHGLSASDVFEDGVSPEGYYSPYRPGDDPRYVTHDMGRQSRTWRAWPEEFPVAKLMWLLFMFRFQRYGQYVADRFE